MSAPSLSAVSSSAATDAKAALEHWMVAALDPTHAQHELALASMQKLLRNDTASSHKIGGFFGNPNAFKSLDATSVCTSGTAANMTDFRNMVLPTLTDIIIRKCRDTSFMSMTDGELADLLDALKLAALLLETRHSYFGATVRGGKGTCKAIVLAIQEVSGGKVGFKLIAMNVSMQSADLYLVEHFSKSRSNFFGSSSNSWSTMRLVEQQSVSAGQLMQACALAAVTTQMVENTAALQQAMQLFPAAPLPGAAGGLPAFSNGGGASN